MPVSTWFVVVRFETGEDWLREIIAALQSLVISLCGDNAECGDTQKYCVGG